MKYQAVILNFDQRSVEYIPAQKLRAPKMPVAAAASGSTPPAPKKPDK
jgi:hypothetical protein